VSRTVAAALAAGALAASLAAVPATPAQPCPAAPSAAQSDPWPAALAQARRVAAGRPGRVAFALVDERGRLRGGARARERYLSASVVKAMLLVAYLNRDAVRGRELRPDERALLDPMVRRSSNRAATRVRDVVGNAALAALARRAGMRDFATAPSWGSTLVTAADLARLFWRIDRLVVRRHRAYARAVLAGVEEERWWGIPPATPDGWTPLFKGGWRKLSNGRLAHQAALVERGGERVALAVLTDGSPDYGSGRRSVLLVARALLEPLHSIGTSSRGAARPAGQSKCHHSRS
jgi:hypothetical protein